MDRFNNTLSRNIKSTSPYELLITVQVRFWLYLIPNTLSLLCSIFVLYHLLFDRTLRQSLNNHIIILLVIIGIVYEVTTVPFMLHFYLVGYSWQLTIGFSHFWTFIDTLCFMFQMIGFAWASMERHILIFHTSWVSTPKKRFFIHYLPVILIAMYCFIYCFVFDLFPFCGDINFPSPTNGVPFSCIFLDPIVAKYDTICHLIIPTFIIAIFSLALLIRAIEQKRRVNRSIDWKKQRKMIIQLLSISSLYLILNFPRAFLTLLAFFDITNELMIRFLVHLAFFGVYTIFLFPFVCCASMPNIDKRIQKLIFCRNKSQQGGIHSITRAAHSNTNTKQK